MTNMNSFLSFVDRQPGQPPLPEYVWIVEGDAFFTGNVRDFVQHYKPETADFIGKYQSRSLGQSARVQFSSLHIRFRSNILTTTLLLVLAHSTHWGVILKFCYSEHSTLLSCAPTTNIFMFFFFRVCVCVCLCGVFMWVHAHTMGLRFVAFLNRWQHWSQKTFDPSSLRPSGKVDIISKAEHVERYSIKLIMHMRGMMEQNKLL